MGLTLRYDSTNRVYVGQLQLNRRGSWCEEGSCAISAPSKRGNIINNNLIVVSLLLPELGL